MLITDCDKGGGKLRAIFGPGRSGTTWLGSLINSHPDLIYRFEPLLRSTRSPFVKSFKSELREGTIDDDSLDRLYNYLRRADPSSDKTPFFSKSYQRHAGKLWFWRAARIFPALKPVYARIYTPQDYLPLVFKEVGSLTSKRLILNGRIPFVYLVRHPCATAHSHVVGQRDGKMPGGRTKVLDSLLQKHDRELHEVMAPRLEGMNAYELNTLVWRIDVERCVNAMENNDLGMMLTYEQLCDDACTEVSRICNHFGLDFHPNMERYAASAYRPSEDKSSGIRDVRDPYFTVQRNPREQRDRWRSVLPAELQERIVSLVSESLAVQKCAELGRWW